MTSAGTNACETLRKRGYFQQNDVRQAQRRGRELSLQEGQGWQEETCEKDTSGKRNITKKGGIKMRKRIVPKTVKTLDFGTQFNRTGEILNGIT